MTVATPLLLNDMTWSCIRAWRGLTTMTTDHASSWELILSKRYGNIKNIKTCHNQWESRLWHRLPPQKVLSLIFDCLSHFISQSPHTWCHRLFNLHMILPRCHYLLPVSWKPHDDLVTFHSTHVLHILIGMPKNEPWSQKFFSSVPMTFPLFLQQGAGWD